MHVFYHPLKWLILLNTYYNGNIFLFLVCSCRLVFYKTPVLHALLYVHESYVNERKLNVHYSIHAFIMRQTYHVRYQTFDFTLRYL